MKTLRGKEASCDTEEWRRWDEDLVEEFELWLGRLAKILGLLLVVVLAALVMR